MISFKKLLAAALVFCAAHVHASPVKFTFTSTITSSAISGVAVGDSVTIDIFADNGGSGLNAQVWTIADIVSGSLTAGSYTQSYVDGWFSSPSHVAFVTNVVGDITGSDFYGTTYSPNHQDSFGVGPYVYLYNGAFQSFFGNMAYYSVALSNTDSWTVTAVNDVPEPGVLAMLGLGLAGLAFARRRAKA